MTRARIAGTTIATVLVLVALVLLAIYRNRNRFTRPAEGASSTIAAPATPEAGTAHPAPESPQGFIYGRITTTDGAIHEGRLRWGGGGEEAFWSDAFNGSKRENPWLAHVPPEQLPKENHSIEILGFELSHNEQPSKVARQLLVRFGDIARIASEGREVRVTLKSANAFVLDRFEASDFDDDVRVWDDKGGVADFDSLQIRTIEFLPTPTLSAVPYRLYGTVHTSQGDFTGFVQWNRDDCVGTDELYARSAEGVRRLRFDTIRSIAGSGRDGCTVTLLDGREIALTGRNDVGRENRGIYVDDRRYGRVVVSWGAFERVDFSAGGSGPGYGDFPPGSPLSGSVTTRAGARLAGRLVYDLDESESIESLDASFQGVDYAIPFGLVASIVPLDPQNPDAKLAKVILHSGEELQVEHTGDLSSRNAGILVFIDPEHPEYVPWSNVARIDLDRPPAMYPPLGR